MHSPQDESRIDRRKFLGAMAAAAATGAVAGAATLAGCAPAPHGAPVAAVPADAIRRPRIIRPGEKLNVACIGIGGKGKSDALAMKGENVVALCDVETDPKIVKPVWSAYPDAKRYRDYRQMLAEMDGQIDAVTVSTPDHTHFPAAMLAISLGKHVFVQKPMSHTIEQARLLTEAARRHGVATQMGNQRHASEGIRLLCEWIAVGAIGDVREVHLWTDRPTGWGKPCGMDRPTDTPPVPETLDWNLWVGTAPMRPYNPLYCPKMWRSWFDFGCGALGDMGCHIMDGAFWALDLGYPLSVEAECPPLTNETFPKWSIITYRFPQRGSMPPLKLVWYDGKKLPPRPKELEANRKLPTDVGGMLFHGDKGIIMADAYCQGPRIIPEDKMRAFLAKPPAKTIPRSPGHVEEWVQACKGGEPAKSNFDYAGPLTEVVLLGNVALRAGRKIEFDTATREIVNAPETSKLLREDLRSF